MSTILLVSRKRFFPGLRRRGTAKSYERRIGYLFAIVEARQCGDDAGFTLLELLIVITILGLLTALAPRLSRNNPGVDVRAAAYTLAAQLRVLRQEAISRGHKTLLAPERANGNIAFFISPTEPLLLPQTFTKIGFFPDGSSTGGKIFVREETAAATLDIDSLDGAVTVHAR